MKKRIFGLVVAILCLALLAPAVLAQEQIARVEVKVAAPVAGEKPQNPDVVLLAQGTGEAKRLSERDGDYTLSAQWREAGATAEMSGTFINGRRYELVVTLKGLLTDYSMESDTELVVNGTKISSSGVVSVRGDDAILTLPFTAVPGDITPAVTVTVDGKAEKEYDGKNVILRAAVTNLLDGVTYEYQWFRGSSAVTGDNVSKDGAELTLRNVADSGIYLCRVTAKSQQETKRTESLTTTVAITPHPVTIVLVDAEKNEGDEDPVLGYSVLGEIYDLIQGDPAREEGEDEGEYVISLGTLAFDEAVRDNYSVTVQTGRFTIVGSGVVTFAPLTEVADLSYVSGKSGSHIRASATKNALPKGALLTLSTVGPDALSALESAAGGKGLMKSLAVAFVQSDGTAAGLRQNAILRLYIPLSEEEEKFDPQSISVLFRTADGSISPLNFRWEEEATGVVYLAVDLTGPGEVALVKGTVLETPDESPEEPAEEPQKKGALWLWILIVILFVAALCVIGWVVIRSAKAEEPTKRYEPKKTAPRPAPQTQEEPGDVPVGRPVPPPATKVVSFEDLEEEATTDGDGTEEAEAPEETGEPGDEEQP